MIMKVKFTTSIDSELLKMFKIKAIEEGVNVNYLLEKIMRENLESEKERFGMKKLYVKWDFEGKIYTGYVEFIQEEDKVRVTANSDMTNQCFYNEIHTVEEAEAIYADIIEADYNIKDIL